MPGPISAEQMQTAIAHGTATPLLPEGVPGPIHHSGQWWCIPHGDADYQPVSGEQAAELDQFAERLAAGAQALQRAQGQSWR
ncbi:hypothetical protein [Saccharopolyspora pogona]|uniref:hypothetical protein n=1 Tax=Saccharopolyspora pogona TaxID=333966 RepID=UPI001688BF2E|nr:hypothetical protein [Saccharopolyspora pogona]